MSITDEIVLMRTGVVQQQCPPQQMYLNPANRFVAGFLHIIRQGTTYNLIFLASCEEEVSGKNGIESALPLLPHIDLALVANPPACNRPLPKRADVLDVTAHASRGMRHATKGKTPFTKP